MKNETFYIALFTFLTLLSLLFFFKEFSVRKRTKILSRLHNVKLQRITFEEHNDLSEPFAIRISSYLAQVLIKLINHVTPKKVREEIITRLERAGNPYNLKVNEFMALQGIIAISLFLVGFFIMTKLDLNFNAILLLIVVTFLGAYMPLISLNVKAKKRKNDIEKNLPDMMDLLVICIEAGLSFDMALLKIVERFKGTISKEFQKAHREMQLGKTRKDVLKEMAERLEVTELTSLVNIIIQSDQLGVGLGNVLRLQSDLIREKYQQKVETKAMKAPVKMLIPLVFFIFPCMFIIILGPAVINIIKNFK